MDELTRDDVVSVIHESTKGMNKLQCDEFIMRLIDIIDPQIPYNDLVKAIEAAKDYVY